MGFRTKRETLAELTRALHVARNVARAATAPSPKAARAPEMRFWTPVQLRDFFEFLADDDLFPLVRLTAMSGARRGEVCGLRWNDVDLDAGRIFIQRQRVTIRHRPFDKDLALMS